VLDIIRKKRDAQVLSSVEIHQFISAVVDGSMPDYQIAAWLMAVYFNGLNDAETSSLIDAMIHTGDVVDLSSIPGIKVDKHSTGGVGDKTSLVLAPIVAAAGVPVAKMSGRGLGHTGGTLDKLESIPGFTVDLSITQFISNVKNYGLAIISQTGRLVPADKKLYALRDVTSTIENKSLIASSIMSKKLASGADAIVIDLKVGSGAFIPDVQKGRELAELMVNTATQMGKKIKVVLSSMQQPLGYAIGNSLEVAEAVATLKNQGPEDLTQLCIELAAHMLCLAEKASDIYEAKSIVSTVLNNGAALDKFREMVVGQGGDPGFIEDESRLPHATLQQSYLSPVSGYISELDAHVLGLVSLELGAGRKRKEESIDHSAGVVLTKKLGDRVEEGDEVAILYTNKEVLFGRAIELMRSAYKFSNEKPALNSLIIDVI
jgi:pyrimidine-nucleoside phosphorylase